MRATPRFRVAFMGTPNFAVPTLAALVEGPDEVVAVVTNPDRRSGRGRAEQSPPVKVFAQAAHLPVFQPRRGRSPETHRFLEACDLDLVVVVAYGHILPQSILDIPRRGCLNVHASLLPALRGAAPINWSIVRGMTTTGVSIMQMDKGMDTGPVYATRALSIGPDETAGQLHDRLMPMGAAALMETLTALAEGSAISTDQNHAAASYAPMMKKSDGLIDWTRDAGALVDQVRGFNPWPGAHTHVARTNSDSWRGQRLKVHRASVTPTASSERPGTVVQSDQGGLVVATGSNDLQIERCQVPGKRAMAAAELLRGSPLARGSLLGNGVSGSS